QEDANGGWLKDRRIYHTLSCKLGIKARGGGRVGHHSFRDTVIGALKAAGVHREMREEYTGHELSDRQEHVRVYEREFSPKALA
ncbi:hypothetical protein, partial [Escherichia coli]